MLYMMTISKDITNRT